MVGQSLILDPWFLFGLFKSFFLALGLMGLNQVVMIDVLACTKKSHRILISTSFFFEREEEEKKERKRYSIA